MPQMAPLSWLTLMLMFIATLLAFSMMNYWMFIYPTKNMEKKTTKTSIVWKW